MKRMSLKRWRELREHIVDGFEAVLDHTSVLDPVPYSEKRDAAVQARNAALKALYEAAAIEPPEGIDPS